ncbi:sensor histidine kinase [Methanobacterium subterraneum]|uniref:PAS domain S-box protein n=1 Tax=Methanobacterium subterraneum TaxID=59277 RepID=A0A7K4DMR1_9EURY|nr:histidine kinase dimerization/phosphoacceptor domain -containing protein [Methanobacterium subterraneum]MBW4256795.1 PAS domain S-box protein [Methanobacterium sp. YSL]NMO09751.1 PAS domain S-box protein [Methanobacterium subterraneum]
MKKSQNRINPRFNAFKIAFIYFVISIAWIIASDQILVMTTANSQLFTTLAIFKGSFFVILTAILIYLLVYRNLVSIKRSEKDLKESERKFREIFNKANDMISVNVMNEDGIPGKFLEVNEVVSKRLGYTNEELLSMTPTDLVSPEKSDLIQVNAEKLFKKGQNTFEIVLVTKDGKEIPVEVNNHFIDYNGKRVSLAVSRDITDRKKSEEQLKSSLEEKIVLLREIHHRVNNNLQIISSLFNLQSNYVDENSKDILMASQSRVKSMAMIHEKLYQSPDLTRINMKDYIESFVSGLFSLYMVETTAIHLQTDLEDIEMGIDTAIPVGLIINELVTNSLKHAFPAGNEGGIIEISFRKEGELLTLKIADNGIGLPERRKIETKKSLGLQLVSNLVNQLDGTMMVSGENGTEVKLQFEELKYKKRL